MNPIKSLFLLVFALASLSACAGRMGQPASADLPAPEKPTWAFEASDVPVDPGFRFGKLDNGMRYVIRQNATPKGTVSVRMEVSVGSLDESDSERGFAHFVEHMAFNGSTNVPEGEMIRLLERKGLAFGADTNAQTSFDHTTYMLDLPRNDPELLDTALMLMRETASELTISQEALDRERGVVLAEMRDRNSWQLRNLEDSMAFFNPASLYAKRLPIGTTEALNAATAQTLRAFWHREYVPRNTTLIVVGDFPADKVEDAIKARFQTWQPAPAEPQPDAGPVKYKDKGRTDIYIDPAMSERVTASRNGVWLDEPDSIAQRQENLLREVGYGIINRRFQRISRQPDPPFRGAGFGTGDTFKSGRTTNLIVDTIDGKWRRGFEAVVEEYRRAMDHGFAAGEVAEQVANIRAGSRNAAASASTRSNGALMNAVFVLLRNDIVPATPQSSLDRLEAFLPQITPERVLAALKREAVPLKDPLIRFQGRRNPEGGAKALRAAWKTGMRGKLGETSAPPPAGFAYTDFGAPGKVASDIREPQLDIREVRFENGVRLNLKHTDIEKDRASVQLSIDGGDFLNTRDNPLATEMASYLPYGGLGKHSQDELQSILAGRTVSGGFDSTAETFVAGGETTPRDLELQLDLMAALVTDPGYRPEGELRYRLNINNFFAQLRATPGSALSNSIGGLLSDDDPRFTLQKVEDYRKLTFARLKTDISDRLAKGAIEIGVVGDIDEAAVIGLVAKTFGALPPREPDFGPYPLQRNRPFTAERNRRVVRHTGPADQSLIRLTWPTRDGSDPQEALALEVLERVVRIELTETLREKLGKAYSPSAASTTSLTWRDYGTFAIAASVETGEVTATRAAIAQTLATLRDTPITDDELQRARQPLLEGLDNALKTNAGWMSLVDRAQTQSDRIDRQLQARIRLMLVSPAQVQALAQKYLQMKDAVEILVLPESAPASKN
jgi:zinc protease